MPIRPPAEVDLSVDLVRRLLADQHPDLADLPVRLVAHGWDNATFRLGPDLAVRLPRREAAAHLIAHEQRWLPDLARRCPVPVPAPVRTGTPSPTFRWTWSVVPWFGGTHAADMPVAARSAWAPALADALHALHTAAPPGAPLNPVRGGPLAGRAQALGDRLTAGHLDHVVPDARARAHALWQDALDAPPWPGAPQWVHGDPHPANLVTRDGTLAALIDFGDMTAGDPACDLATAWLTFETTGRDRFRERTDALTADAAPDPGRWRRAAGWALVMSSAMVAHGDDDPVISAIGHHAVRELLVG